MQSDQELCTGRTCRKQYLYKEFYSQGLRVKNTSGSYSRTIDGEMILEEITKIFDRQNQCGNIIPEEFQKK